MLKSWAHAGCRRRPGNWSIWPASRLIATAGADVCLANYLTTAYVAVASKWLRGDRAVLAYNVRGYEPLSHGLNADASLPSRLVRAALAWVSYRLPLQKICTTDWLREQTRRPISVRRRPRHRSEVFRPAPERADGERVVVGTIGRLGEAKGYPDFLRAVDSCRPTCPSRFGSRRRTPSSCQTRFPRTVEHPRPEREMSEFYARCDIFVFSSRGEGFGLPALEAMAVGCPVITTDSGGVRQFATDSENCLMTPPADAAVAGPVAISPPRARPVAPHRSASGRPRHGRRVQPGRRPGPLLPLPGAIADPAARG